MMVQVKGKGRGSASSQRDSAPTGAIALRAQGHCTQATPAAGTTGVRTLPRRELSPPAPRRGLSPPQKQHGIAAAGSSPEPRTARGAADGKLRQNPTCT